MAMRSGDIRKSVESIHAQSFLSTIKLQGDGYSYADSREADKKGLWLNSGANEGTIQ